MSHTDIILIIVILGLSSTAGVYVLVRKINQYTPIPQNALTRRGDIELNDFIEPTQPLPVYYPRCSLNSEPINLIQSNPVVRIESNPLEILDSITVIEGLNSDPISTIVSPLDSIVESLDYDSSNLEPIYYNIDELFIHSILENENIINPVFIIIVLILFIIIIYLVLNYKTKSRL